MSTKSRIPQTLVDDTLDVIHRHVANGSLWWLSDYIALMSQAAEAVVTANRTRRMNGASPGKGNNLPGFRSAGQRWSASDVTTLLSIDDDDEASAKLKRSPMACAQKRITIGAGAAA